MRPKFAMITLTKLVFIVKQLGHRALMAKTDINNAFRLLPIFPLDRCLLGFTWKSDKDVRQFYVDYCLPMGLSVSWRYFEIFSSALQWIIVVKYGTVMTHTIDNFFFVGPLNFLMCGISLSRFLSTCDDIGIRLKIKLFYRQRGLSFMVLRLILIRWKHVCRKKK